MVRMAVGIVKALLLFTGFAFRHCEDGRNFLVRGIADYETTAAGR
jgi:hypothetical protein